MLSKLNRHPGAATAAESNQASPPPNARNRNSNKAPLWRRAEVSPVDPEVRVEDLRPPLGLRAEPNSPGSYPIWVANVFVAHVTVHLMGALSLYDQVYGSRRVVRSNLADLASMEARGRTVTTLQVSRAVAWRDRLHMRLIDRIPEMHRYDLLTSLDAPAVEVGVAVSVIGHAGSQQARVAAMDRLLPRFVRSTNGIIGLLDDSPQPDKAIASHCTMALYGLYSGSSSALRARRALGDDSTDRLQTTLQHDLGAELKAVQAELKPEPPVPSDVTRVMPRVEAQPVLRESLFAL